MYHAVGNRCVAELAKLPPNALEVLEAKGFKICDVDMIAEARSLIGESKYRRGVYVQQAPQVVDCSSFVKYLYGLRGIWLPRLAIQQRSFGTPVELDELEEHDLVFTAHRRYHRQSSIDCVGHVGIVTEKGTIVHASRTGVQEVTLGEFVRAEDGYRGACRVFEHSQCVTLEIPAGIEVETSDDLFWLTYRSPSS